ncbi:hypothetical protein RB598_005190 [Gaeumannomyces tritici]
MASTGTSNDTPLAQDKTVVSFLGPLASYSHQATTALFPGQGWDLAPVPTIRGVFDAVQAGTATYGVVPFENSTHGVVTFTLDCLGDRAAEYAGVSVCAEHYLDVHHFLLGRLDPSSTTTTTAAAATTTATEKRERGKPLASLAHVRHVYSHPQAFGQTSRFAAAYLSHAELTDVSSTSRAAELAAADAEGASAAIASEAAAAPNGLDVLAACIEDREDNTTRFLVIRKGDDDATGAGPSSSAPPSVTATATATASTTCPPPPPPPPPQQNIPPPPGTSKSLVSFTVPHRSPGSLADVLQCFRRAGLNLTSINSLPSLIRPFQYLFFVEFEVEAAADAREKVAAVLADVRRVAHGSRWLGSWESRR